MAKRTNVPHLDFGMDFDWALKNPYEELLLVLDLDLGLDKDLDLDLDKVCDEFLTFTALRLVSLWYFLNTFFSFSSSF